MAPGGRKPEDTSSLRGLPEESDLAASSPVALVIEDDPEAAHLAARMLTHLGYRHRIATDADEALAALIESTPSLVLLDICLPGMDGISLMRVVRSMRSLDGVPLVGASGVYPEDGAVTRLLAKEGVYSFLSKPYTVDGLRKAIDYARTAAMRRSAPPTPTMHSSTLPEREDSAARRERREREKAAAALEAPPPSAQPAPQSPAEAAPSPPPTDVATEPKPKATRPTTGEAPAFKPSGFRRSDVPRPPEPSPRFRRADVAGPPTPSAQAVGSEQSDGAFSIFDSTLDFPLLDAEGKDISGRIAVGDRRGTVVIETCDRDTLQVHSTDLDVPAGVLARLEISFQRGLSGSMAEVTVRILGSVEQVEFVSGTGWRYRIKVTAARPTEAFDQLVTEVAPTRL